MHVVDFLFSFRGRVNRAKYWLFSLGAVVLLFAAGALIARATALPRIVAIIVSLGVIIVAIALVVASCAVGVKRLHDRDKSGWWFPFFVFGPSIIHLIDAATGRHGGISLTLGGAAISIWALVELGFLRGTDGDNGYGPDPRFSSGRFSDAPATRSGGEFADAPASRAGPLPDPSLARVSIDVSEPKTFGRRGNQRAA
jgi:uncharacterized membrane protein YhaH (DUF805 family)